MTVRILLITTAQTQLKLLLALRFGTAFDATAVSRTSRPPAPGHASSCTPAAGLLQCSALVGVQSEQFA